MVLVCALLLIAFATLLPIPGETQIQGFCLICGSRGTADLLLNILLFMPLGAALARRGTPRIRVFLFGLLLSGTIECAQFFIPGRDPSVSDVIANTCGAVLGALIARSAHVWLTSRPPPGVGSRLCRAASAVAALLCLVTGLLLTPAYPDSPYFGLWTPDLGHLVTYRGRVLSATLNGESIADGPIHASDRIRAALESPGTDLRVRAIAGPEPEGLSPVFAIFDQQRREILLLGLDRKELVLRLRTRASDARLDRPEMRVRGDWRQSDTASVAIVARAGRYDINGAAAGFTVGSGWGLFLYPQHLPFKSVVDAAWIAMLFVPAAFWSRTRGDAAIVALGVLGGLALVPALTPLQPTPPAQWLATALGIGLGAVLQRFIKADAEVARSR
jgi:VanZ like family